MAEKMSVKAQAEVRATLYFAARDAMENLGYTTETIATGALVHLPDGQYAEVNISIKDPTKFDLQAARDVFAEKQVAAAARAEKAAEKAAKEAEKKAKAAAEAKEATVE